MVINEEALVKQMNDAYKTHGYTVARVEENIFLTNGFWLAMIDIDHVPGEIMGMFGAHIREIPEDGDAYKVIKAKDGPIVQSRMLEDVLKTVEHMETEAKEAFAEIPLVMMRRTNLTYEGMQVWQACPGLDVYLIDPRYAAMIKDPKDVSRVGNGIYTEGNVSKLWIMRVVKQEDNAYLKHLEQMAWITG